LLSCFVMHGSLGPSIVPPQLCELEVIKLVN